MSIAVESAEKHVTKARVPIHVVHLVSTLNIGGLEKVVYDLVRVADRTRLTARVICLGEIGALAGDFAKLEIPVEALNLADRRPWITVPRLVRRLRHLRPDVLHTHNPMPHLVGAVAARLSGVPVVVHTKHGRNYPGVRRKVFLNRALSWLTDRIVPVSHNAAEVALNTERIPPEKVEVIWNGIDTERFAYMHRPPRETTRRAVHVARLSQESKDQVTLLRAVRLVADCEPNFILDIVGDGPDRQRLEQLCDELCLQDHLRFHGFRDDVHTFLGTAEFFVLSSVTEGLSLTLLEAMATGLPIVATDVGGNAEVVIHGETGLIVPARSPEALANAMLELLRKPGNTDQMGLAARRRAEEQFDLRRAAACYDALYRELMAMRQYGRERS
jgi:sugar transferase (PEP-CTERM/EpsH1 system associated)